MLMMRKHTKQRELSIDFYRPQTSSAKGVGVAMMSNNTRRERERRKEESASLEKAGSSAAAAKNTMVVYTAGSGMNKSERNSKMK